MWDLLKNIMVFAIAILVVILTWRAHYQYDINQIAKALKVDENHLPYIKNPKILDDALVSAVGWSDNPLNIPKKIGNAYAAQPFKNDADAKSDFIKISLHFYNLLILAEPTIIKSTHSHLEEKILIALRNSSAHDNYFYLFLPDGWNTAAYDELKNKLGPTDLKLLNDLEPDGWVIWNIHYGLKIFIIINNKKLWAVVQTFAADCQQIVEKSKSNQP